VIIVSIFFWVLGIMFVVGMVGSAVVVILTSIEDIKELRGDKEPESLPKRVEEGNFQDSLLHGA